MKSKKMPAGDSGTIDGLESNKKYDVAVAALNLRGEGPRSDSIEVQTKEGGMSSSEISIKFKLIINSNVQFVTQISLHEKGIRRFRNLLK